MLNIAQNRRLLGQTVITAVHETCLMIIKYEIETKSRRNCKTVSPMNLLLSFILKTATVWIILDLLFFYSLLFDYVYKVHSFISNDPHFSNGCQFLLHVTRVNQLRLKTKQGSDKNLSSHSFCCIFAGYFGIITCKKVSNPPVTFFSQVRF